MSKQIKENNKKENKTMENTRKQEVKQPLKVEVKVALPWTLIILAAAIVSSLIVGWNLRSDDISRVKSEAQHIAELSKSKQ